MATGLTTAEPAKRTELNLKSPQSSLLLESRKAFEGLSHLQNLEDANKQDEIVSSLRTAIDKIRSTLDGQPTAETLQSAFLEKYVASMEEDGSIAFTIPKGASVADLLRDAQTVSFALRGVVAVYPNRLAAWMNQEAFTNTFESEASRMVQPVEQDTEWKTRDEQLELLTSKNLRLAEAWELAAAHAIFSVLENKKHADLFDGNVIRVKGTKLYYGDGGLSEMDENEYINNCRYQRVRMASAKTV